MCVCVLVVTCCFLVRVKPPFVVLIGWVTLGEGDEGFHDSERHLLRDIVLKFATQGTEQLQFSFLLRPGSCVNEVVEDTTGFFEERTVGQPVQLGLDTPQ